MNPAARVAPLEDNESGVQRDTRLKSALQEYSELFDEIQKEKLNSNNVAKQVLEPKIDYINELLGQHLLQKEYSETYKDLQNEKEECKLTPLHRVFVDNMGEMREVLMKSFYKGSEKEFFKAREKIYEELNYYKLDYQLSPEIEMKLHAYFTVYYLIPMNKKKMSIEEAMRLTRERCEDFKKYTTEHGGKFMDDPEYKHYLRLPYLLQTLPKDDALLERLLSDEFPIKLMEESLQEIDEIIFYSTKVTKNRSFLTKAFEYNLKYNPEFHTPSIQQVYDRIKSNIEEHSAEIDSIQQENDDLDVLTARLQRRFDDTKDTFIRSVEQEEDKHLHLKGELIQLASFHPVTPNQKYINWQYNDIFDRLVRLRKAMTANITKKNRGKIDDLEMRVLQLEFAKLRQEIRRPQRRNNGDSVRGGDKGETSRAVGSSRESSLVNPSMGINFKKAASPSAK